LCGGSCLVLAPGGLPPHYASPSGKGEVGKAFLKRARPCLVSFSETIKPSSLAEHSFGSGRGRRLRERFARKSDVLLCRWRDLGFVLVEVERGVELRLARAQVVHARFMVEGLVCLGLIIGQRLLHARAVLLFLIREFI